MLKTTKEFDFVYKNSYKFRTEMLDICILKPNLTEQFFARFRRLPCNVVGFSVSKKVGIAVERNLVKRRLRAICRDFFGKKNSSLGAPFALGKNFGEQQTTSLVLSPKFLPNTKLPPQILELDSNKNNSSESKRGSIFDEKSGLRSHERGNKTWSLLTKRVASLPDLSQKDKRASSANLICIFIAKSQILQTPFSALKNTIFATLKRQLNFKKNSHTSPRNFSANRPQTKAKQNENR